MKKGLSIQLASLLVAVVFVACSGDESGFGIPAYDGSVPPLDLGTQDTAADSGADLGDYARPAPEAYGFVEGEHEQPVESLLLDWGLDGRDTNAVRAELAGLLSGESCANASELILAGGSRTVDFACLRAFRLGLLEAVVFRGRVTSTDVSHLRIPDFHVAIVSAGNGGEVIAYSTSSASDIESHLEAAGVHRQLRSDAAAEALDMLSPMRCDRSVNLFPDDAGDATGQISCAIGSGLKSFRTSHVLVRSGTNLAGLELLGMRLDDGGPPLAFGVVRSATVERYEIERSEDLAQILSSKITVPTDVAESWAANFEAFMTGTGHCPRVREWTTADNGQHVFLRYLPGTPVGWLTSCHLRAETIALDPSDRNEVVTLSGHRGLYGGPVFWVEANDVPERVDLGLSRGLIAEELATELSDNLIGQADDNTCPSPVTDAEEIDETFRLSCETVFSGLPELGVVLSRTVLENGFEPAQLLGAEPAPVSTLWFPYSAFVSPEDESPSDAVLVSWAPRTVTETTVRGTHAATISTRLTSWGISSEAAEDVVERLNTLIADHTAEIVPVIVEEEEVAIFFNTGWTADADTPSLHVVHALRRGGPELELIVLPNRGAGEDTVVLRNNTEATVLTALGDTIDEFATPASLADDLLDVYLQILSGVTCPELDTLVHPDLAGDLGVDCTPLTFSQPRPSLEDVGFVATWFDRPEGSEAEGFPVLDLDFFRPHLEGEGAMQIVDGLVVLHPQYSSPTLPPVLGSLLVVDGGEELNIISDEAVRRGLSESEARLVQTTLEQLVDSGCAEVDDIPVELDGRAVSLGCIPGSVATELDLSLASLHVSDEPAQWTVFTASDSMDSGYALYTTPAQLLAGMTNATSADPDYSEAALGAIFGLLSTTPAEDSGCDDDQIIALSDQHTVKLTCTPWALLVEEETALGTLNRATGVVTRWLIVDGDNSGYVYWFDDPKARGDGVAADSFFYNLAETGE